jgi:HPt (histidine-containing phosphotransfer) domain-containing protein
MDLDAFWKQFEIECIEHIDIIEGHLIQAEHQAVNEQGIAELFRSFHSIKGLSRSMDLHGMEHIAHLSEDILGIVREGKASIDLSMTDLLLHAVDTLKHLIHVVTSQQSDEAAPESLLKNLESLKESLGDVKITVETDYDIHGTSPGVIPVEPEQTVDISHLENIYISHDPDTVRYFLETIASEINQLISVSFDHQKDLCVRSIDTLRHSYHIMGFDRLTQGLDGLGFTLDLSEFIYYTHLQHIISDLRIQTLEDGSVLSAFDPDCFKNLQNNLIRKQISIMIPFLENCEQNEHLKEYIPDTKDLALSMGFSFQDIFPDLFSPFFFAIESFIGEMRRLMTHNSFSQLRSRTCENLTYIDAILSRKRKENEKNCEKLNTLMRETSLLIDEHINALPVEIPPFEEGPVTLSMFPQDLIEKLSDGEHEKIKQKATSQSHNLYVVLAYLESDPVFAQRFIDICQDTGELVTNRSIIIQKR